MKSNHLGVIDSLFHHFYAQLPGQNQDAKIRFAMRQARQAKRFRYGGFPPHQSSRECQRRLGQPGFQQLLAAQRAQA
jgi:hypothetical protein